jgi:hypothetical protein
MNLGIHRRYIAAGKFGTACCAFGACANFGQGDAVRLPAIKACQSNGIRHGYFPFIIRWLIIWQRETNVGASIALNDTLFFPCNLDHDQPVAPYKE